MTDTIWRDDPPTEPGWYYVDCEGITSRSVPDPPQRIGWLKPTGWSIPSVGFGLDGEYLREIGINFGPRIPNPETCAKIERGE